MEDLPIKRLEPAPPFTHVAIDCFGPYTVTEREKKLRDTEVYLFVMHQELSI